MNTVSAQAYAEIYDNLEASYQAALQFGDIDTAIKYASYMRQLENAGLVPVIEMHDDDGMVLQ